MVYKIKVNDEMSIIIHSKSGCPFCDKAKLFLESKNISYKEIHYDTSMENYEILKNELMTSTKQNTFPQIFVGDVFVGGYTQLIHSFDSCQFHEWCSQIGLLIEADF